MEKEVQEQHEVSLGSLLTYAFLFMAPLGVAYFISLFMGNFTAEYLQVSRQTAANMYMVVWSLLIFAFVVPYVRKKESIEGVRFTILAVVVVGVGLAIPGIVTKGDYSLLFSELIYFGNYLLVTFVFCPEVLGIIRDIRVWFKHHGQLILILIYLGISLSYVFGFGTLYYQIDQTATIDKPFFYSGEDTLDVWGHVYYSLVTFATLGYGEISPHATAARIVAGVEAMLGMLINVVFIAILLTFISAAASEAKAKKKVKKNKEEIEKKKRIQDYILNQMRKTRRNVNTYIDQIYNSRHGRMERR